MAVESGPNLTKPEIHEPRGKLPPVELMRELTRLCRLEGMAYHRAYAKIFPHRKHVVRTAATQARLLVERYIRDHADDLREMLLVYGLNKERLAAELSQRLRANTLHEVVRSEVVKVKSKDGRTRPVVLTRRDTEEVQDNRARMDATVLLADIHGARKLPEGGAQPNVAVIYVTGGPIKKKRQERIA